MGYLPIILVTKDVNLRIKADVLGIPAEDFYTDKVVTLLGRAGRAFVESHHDWDTIGERLEAIYSKAVQAGDAQSIPNSTLPVMGLAQVQ